MGKSLITIRDFLERNPCYIKVTIDFQPYYDMTDGLCINKLTDTVLDKRVAKVAMNMDCTLYEIMIFTESED